MTSVIQQYALKFGTHNPVEKRDVHGVARPFYWPFFITKTRVIEYISGSWIFYVH
jgi:hypothetical protein